MDRKEYDEIKDRFAIFCACLEKGSAKELNQCLKSDAACYLSIEKAYPEGGRHGLIGMSDFIDSLPQTDYCRVTPYNFVARIQKGRAQQSAEVCGIAGRQGENGYEVCEFCGIFSNEWEKTEAGWKIKTLRMDMQEICGDFTEYYKDWYFEKEQKGWYPGIHLPVISGELDNPWKVIQNNEVVLSDEELIMETFANYAFSIDFLSIDGLRDVFEADSVINMAPFGAMDRREFMQTIKVHREGHPHWFHPAEVKSICIKDGEAYVQLYRMGGHRQRHRQIVYTEDNIDRKYACARYELKMVKRKNQWKIHQLDYFLGILDVTE